MYTRREQSAAASIIKQIAREHHASEADVRAEMEEAMNAGRNKSDPAVQARWATFRYAGAEPTLEEFIPWIAIACRERLVYNEEQDRIWRIIKCMQL